MKRPTLVMGAILAMSMLHGPSLSASDATQVRAIVEGFRANRASFSFYTCKYDLREWRVATLEEAVSGVRGEALATAAVQMVVDKANLCYVRTSDTSIHITDEKTRQGYMQLPSGALIATDRLTLSYRPMIGVAAFVDNFRHVDISPWNLCGMLDDGPRSEFGEFMSFYLDNPSVADVAVSEGHTTRNIDTVKITLKSGEVHVEFFVDESRGFVPIQQDSYVGGRLFSRSYTVDIRDCGRGRWFPTRAVGIWLDHNDTDGIEHLAREMHVVSLDTTTQPRRREFVIDVPAGTQIHDGVSPSSAYSLTQDDRINLEGLDRIHEVWPVRKKLSHFLI